MQFTMRKIIIFDWSGVLSDNFHVFYRVVQKMFRELGYLPPSEEEVHRTFTMPYMVFWNKHIPSLTKEKQDELYKKYIFQEESPHIFPKVKEAILHLYSKGVRMFIVSSDNSVTLLSEVKKSGLQHCFEKIYPDAHDKQAVIKEVIEQNHLKNEDIYYIGDTVGDIEAGKSNGIKTVGVSWGFQHTEILAMAKPDMMLDDVSQLKSFA